MSDKKLLNLWPLTFCLLCVVCAFIGAFIGQQISVPKSQGQMCLFIPDGDPNVMVVKDRDGSTIFNITQTGEIWHRGYKLIQDEELAYYIGKDNQRRYDNGQDIGGDPKLQEKIYDERAADLRVPNEELLKRYGDDRDELT